MTSPEKLEYIKSVLVANEHKFEALAKEKFADMFPGVKFLEPWFGKITVLYPVSGQPCVVAIYGDCSWCKQEEYDESKSPAQQPWRNWVVSVGFIDSDSGNSVDYYLHKFGEQFKQPRRVELGAVDGPVKIT